MLGEKIRIIGIYASERDFNVDMNNDTQSSEALLQWTDACSLAPCIPDAATSLASNRTIDYALSNGVPLSIQTQGIATRFLPAQTSAPFSSKTKRIFKPANSSLQAFLLGNGEIVEGRSQMVDIRGRNGPTFHGPTRPVVTRQLDGPARTDTLITTVRSDPTR
ncbi:unnamed protein product [Rotaria socialis]|uniref:Uncharacterized protein n=1 Tax=Rotaria socialis TaxID=392032 RepID=A0A821PP99_9BILA|nr:unnamed protein product [Rotaria socialis]